MNRGIKRIVKLMLAFLLAFTTITMSSNNYISAQAGDPDDFVSGEVPLPSLVDVSQHFVLSNNSGNEAFFHPDYKNVLVLNLNKQFKSGVVWSKEKVSLNTKFRYETQVYFGRSAGMDMLGVNSVKGADGFTFTIQNDPAGISAIGGGGHGLGAYKITKQVSGEALSNGIKNSISFEYDGFNDYFDGEPGLQGTLLTELKHTGFVNPQDPDGIAKHFDLKRITAYPKGIDMQSTWVDFNAEWVPNTDGSGVLKITLDGVESVYTIPDYVTYFGGDSAYFGYTGGTGGATELQAIAVLKMPQERTLNFDLNISDESEEAEVGTPPSQLLLEDTTIANLPTPKRTGYTFDGWYIDENGDTPLQDGAKMPDNDLTLYAKWTPNKVNVTFVSEVAGASDMPSIQVIDYDTNAVIPPLSPILTGYTFIGWFKDNQIFNFNTSIKSDTTLIAKWSENQFAVNFEIAETDAIGKPNNQTVKENGTAIEPISPKLAGYTFDGWYIKEENGDTSIKYDFDTPVTKEITLVGKWILNQYTITYDPVLSGVTAPANETVNEGELFKEPTAKPSKLGYRFLGWYYNLVEYKFDTAATSNITVRAAWEEVYYDVKYIATEPNVSNIPTTQSVREGSSATDPLSPKRPGYMFDGWYVGNVKYDFTLSVMENLELTAHWKAIEYTLIFDPVLEGVVNVPIEQKVLEGETFVAPPSDSIPSVNGYTFKGWYFNLVEYDYSTPATANIILRAAWEKNNYTVTFDVVENGVTNVPSDQIIQFENKASKPATPMKDGYTFVKWLDREGNEFDFENTEITSNITLEAEWKVNSYQITYTSEVSTAEGIPSNHTVTYLETIPEPETPSAEGYHFEGWYKDGAVYNFTDKVTANVTLVAKWGVNQYDVQFKVEDSGVVDVPKDQLIDHGKEAIEPNEPKRDGYTFGGWKDEKTGEKFDFENPITENITLIPMWNEIEYQITYTSEVSTAEGIPSNQTVTYLTTIPEPEAPSAEGYHFEGWYKDGVAYNFTDKVTSNINLVAKWTPMKLNVTFKADQEVTNVPANQVVDYNTKATEPKDPSKVGYTFDGWYITFIDDVVSDEKFNFSTNITNDVIVSAKWTPIEYTVTFDSVLTGVVDSPTNQTVVYGEKFVEPTQPSKEGYTFVEWQLNTTKYEFGDVATSDITLKAVWEKIKYDVTFDVVEDNVKNIPANQTVDHGTLVKEPSDPIKEGYTFDGWIDKNGVDYKFDVPVTENTTITAKWKINEYAVTYSSEIEGATGLPKPQDVEYLSVMSKPVENPVLLGYDFLGWYKDGIEYTFEDGITSNINLVARWSVKQFNVTFDVVETDVTNTPKNQVVEYGKVVIEPKIPIKDGYIFDGWYDKETDQKYDFDNPVTEKDVDLVAKWTPIVYTLTFDPVLIGVSNVPEKQTVNAGDKFEVPLDPDPIIKGYTFKGWYFNLVEYDYNTPATANITLRAAWEKNNYTVTFDVVESGVANIPSNQIVQFEDKATKPASPTKDGYTFVKWEDSEGNEFNFENTPIIENVTLKATWVINEYSVTYSSEIEGATGLPGPQDVEYLSVISKPVENPVLLGYDFLGWYKDGIEYKFEDGITSNINLVARWSVKQFNVTFDVVETDVTNTPKDQVVEYGKEVTEPKTPTKDGYTFDGWYDKETDKKYDFDNPVTEKDVDLVAKWTANTYDVTYSSEIESDKLSGMPSSLVVNHNDTITSPTTPTLPGYTFQGWYKDGSVYAFGTEVKSNINLVARWTPVMFKVDFEVETGVSNVPKNQSIEYNNQPTEPKDPTKPGYTFDGWVDKETGKDFNFDEPITDKSVTLIPKWSVNEHKVSFISEKEGAEGMPTEINVAYNSKVSQPDDPTLKGHTFDGWYLNDVKYDFDTLMPDNDLTLVAKWIVNTYTVDFTSEKDGANGMPDMQEVEYNTKVTKPVDPTLGGYEFIGWFDGNEEFDFDQPISDNNVTLVAKWKEKEFKVNFDVVLEGVSDAPVTQNVKYNTVATLPKEPSKTGYTFEGWYVGDVEYDFSQKITEADVNLQAKWKIIERKVTFDVVEKDVKNVPANQVVEYATKAQEPLTPSKDGYTFVGWYEGDTKYDFNNPVTDKDINLVGKWTINSYKVSYDVNGGDVKSKPLDQSVKFGGSITTPKNPTKEGYTFVGWYYENIVFNFTTKMPAHDIVLQAKWQINSYTVDFKDPGNDKSKESEKVDYGKNVAQPKTPTKPGYEFVGWNTDPNGKGKTWDFNKDVVKADTTLYAIWKKIESKPNQAVDPKPSTAPTTGDATNVSGYLNMLLLSAALIIVTKKRRKNNNA